MEQIEVQFEEGKTVLISKGIFLKDLLPTPPGVETADPTVAARIDGKLVDLQAPLERGGVIKWIPLSSDPGIEILRHSTSHVMAQAVQSLFPDAKVTIGPSIKDGFYYDFDIDRGFSPEDFPAIEKKMREIIDRDLPIIRRVVSRAEAIRTFRERKEPYKVELIEDLPDPQVTLYQQGGFIDLCRGPHLPSTGKIKAFKLISVAGAYWRGDERNKMLQRIYGTAFPSTEALENHLFLLEEARRRDHRKLGR